MRSLLDGLQALIDRPGRIIVGLISGTSADAIDAAVCWIRGRSNPLSPRSGPGSGVRLLHYHEHPYDPSVRERVRNAPDLRARDVAELNVLVGGLFADACLAALRGAGLDPR